MNDLDSRCERCEREVERLRGEFDALRREIIEVGLRGEFDALRSEIIELVRGVLARADEILAEVEIFNRQMVADLRAQTDAGFASLRACIDAASRTAASRTERKDDEPPKLN
jgi:hypothetical protein